VIKCPEINNDRPRELRSKEGIEAFIYWSASILMLLLGLICTVIYFNKGVNQDDMILAVRIQLVSFTTALFCCPLMPIPSWFPFKSQYRFFVFTVGIVCLEIISQTMKSSQ
jgi:hypothetical protein